MHTSHLQAPAISLCEHPLCSMENIFSCICLENGFGILEHWNRGSIQWRRLYIQVVKNVFTSSTSIWRSYFIILYALAHIHLHFMDVQYWSNERDDYWPYICVHKCIEMCVIYFQRNLILNRSSLDLNDRNTACQFTFTCIQSSYFKSYDQFWIAI